MCLMRRFDGQRGNTRMLRPDKGSNFIGAEKELSKGFLEMDQNKIRSFLQNLGRDCIIWKNNSPAVSQLEEFWSTKSSQQGQYWDHYSELTDRA